MKKNVLLSVHGSLLSRISLFLCLALFCVLSTTAQTVTISPQSGHLMSAYTSDPLEKGYEAGYGSMWKHNQVALTLTTSDDPNWSPDGLMQNHSNDMKVYNDNLIFATGADPTYYTLAMPTGYRIVQYEITFINDLDAVTDRVVLDDVFTSLPFKRLMTWSFGEVARANIINKGVPTYMGGTTLATITTTDVGKEFTISRTDPDMGNILYFCFAGNVKNNNLAALRVKSIKLMFAADDEFAVDLVPDSITTTKASLTDNYFLSRRIDVGAIEPRTKGAETFFSYKSNAIKQLDANVQLYEESAVTNGTWDKTAGKKLISSLYNEGKLHYALQSGTYYIEAPNAVYSDAGDGKVNKMPAAYRIVGAKFDCTYGKETTTLDGGFYIKTTLPDGSAAYLDQNAKWSTTPTTWKQDEFGVTYTVGTAERHYLAPGPYDSTKDQYALATYPTNYNFSFGFYLGKMYYDVSGYGAFYYVKGGDTPYLDYWGTIDDYAYQEFVGNTFTPTDYTLTVYDERGDVITDPYVGANVTLSAANPTAVVDLGGYNNDAIKFKVETATPGADALMNITVYLEPLEPFIHSVDVVAKGDLGEEVSKTVYSVDFHLNGGVINLKVPQGFAKTSAQLMFNNLTALHCDDTYLNYPGIGNARYSFVASPYYDMVNNDLYGNAAIVADHDYTDKIYTNEVGNVPFKFNNADALSNTSGTTTTQYLIDRQFTMADYGNATINGTTGTFSTDNALLSDGQEKEMYLFTTDETRHNIAPTTLEMHRAFAYYNTTVTLQMSNYTPVVKWVPVYDNTFYLKNGAETKEKLVGAAMQTTDAGIDGSRFGYLTVSQIRDAMAASIAAKDPGAPASMDQVLYVDNSELYSVLSNNPDGTKYTLAQLRANLAKNSMIYIPSTATTIVDGTNVAIMAPLETYAIGHTDFVIEDKQPFFAPYSVKLDDNKLASYTRQVTTTNYVNGSQYATLALPFGLSIDDSGMYTDAGSGSKLQFSTLTLNNSIAPNVDGTNYLADATFTNVAPDDSGRTVPNVPYLVTIMSPSKSGVFVANQPGAFIAATEGLTSALPFVKGLVSNGTWNGVACTFTPKSCYSGAEFAQDPNSGLFYFSKDKFVALANLSTSNTLKVFPFRAFYDFQAAAAPAKMFTAFRMVFDGKTTGIETVAPSESKALNITTDGRLIIAQSGIDSPLRVVNLSGQTIANTTIKAGEQKQFSVMPGIYLVNDTKVIVR